MQAERLRRSLKLFVASAWHLVEPGTPFVNSWHIDAICEHLQAVTEGQIKRLIINVPPRTGKSTLVSILWPCWEWARDPSKRFMFASYAEQLAFLMSVRRRDNVIMSKWYQDRWGSKYVLGGSLNLKHLFSNDKSGHMFATSTGGQVTGYGGSRLVLDDPHDPKGAESEVKRETTTEWLNLTWPSRLDPVPGAAEVVIMQRLHEQDATGIYLARRDKDTVLLKIPMEFKGHKNATRLGFEDPRSKPNELLTPLYPKERVDELRRTLGPYGAAGQLDQEPSPTEGGIIKRAWIRHYDQNEEHLRPESIVAIPEYNISPKDCLRFATVDLAVTKKDVDKPDPDYTVIGAWCIFQSPRGPIVMLLDLFRDRIEGPDIEKEIATMHKRWRFQFVAVEQIAGFIALGQMLKRAGLPIRDIGTSKDSFLRIEGDKPSRTYGATPLMADGRFFVPTMASWLGDYIKELIVFPNFGHDDQVDVTSSAVAIAQKLKAWQNTGSDAPTRTTPRNNDDSRRRESPMDRLMIQP